MDLANYTGIMVGCLMRSQSAIQQRLVRRVFTFITQCKLQVITIRGFFIGHFSISIQTLS